MIFRSYSDCYTRIPNQILEDERLLWEAKSILVYLLSKPDIWELNVRHLTKIGNAKQHKIYRMLRELQQYDYVQKHRKSSGHVMRVEAYINRQRCPMAMTEGRLRDANCSQSSELVGNKRGRLSRKLQ